MKTLKRLFALVICLVLVVSCLTGCHKKGEIAVKIGDVEFTSGYYACALVFSDTEARSIIEEELSAEGDLPEKIDYFSYKVEDTEYVKWVEQNTLDTLKDLAAAKTLCKEAGVELDAETSSDALSNAEYMWDTYGYSVLLEANGVSEATFKQYMQDTYLTDTYFEHLYGKDGEKEIAVEELNIQLLNNYVLVNIIEVDYSGLEDEQKEDKLNQLAVYHDALKAGTKTFEEIYLEYNEISADSHTHGEAEEGEIEPLDHHATLLGSEDTDYASEYYSIAKEMAIGEIKVATLEGEDGIALIVKKDLSADPYYLKTYDSILRSEIASEEYLEEIAAYGENLKCTINESSIKQFKVKKITYPEGMY